jgi:RNAse (barnase) inhibitor barstar
MSFVRLDTTKITDWASFHQVCKEAFGFPDFYGKNMNAWIDCMSSLDEEGMTKFLLGADENLNIEIIETEIFNSRLPEIFKELIECTAFVNQRYIERNGKSKIALIFI